MVTVNEFAKKLKSENSVAIFCHVRPDGDTIGSAFALKYALELLGKKADVFCDDIMPKKFDYFENSLAFKETIDGVYSAFVAVDVADNSRLGRFESEFLRHKNTYCLDHHVSNTRYAKTVCVIDKASNVENIFTLINAMDVEINSEIAQLLLTGIVTDTGNFKHSNVTSETLLVASELVKKGAKLNVIVYNNFTKQTQNRAKLFGEVMAKIRYFCDDRLGVITVRKDDFTRTGATKEETEGFIDFVMGIDTVEVGVCLMEMEKNKFKISFRSKSTDVNAIANVFGGGGHVHASGCQIHGDYEEVVDKIRYAVSQHLID